MKKLNKLCSALLLGGIFFASCGKLEEPKAEIEQVEQVQEFIEFAPSIEDIPTETIISADTGEEVPKTQLRMDFMNLTDASGANAGVRFKYKAGEELKAHLFFKQGSTIKHKTEVFTVKQHEAGTGKYSLNKKNIALPTGISFNNSAEIYVSGAIGVTGGEVISGQARVNVPSSGKLIQELKNYTVPMYFPFTKAERPTASKPDGVFSPHFLFYGAIIGVQITNPHRTKFMVRELEFTTNAFDTEGIINLTNATTTNLPTWTGRHTSGVTKRIVEMNNLAGDSYVPAKDGRGYHGSKWFFAWVKPNNIRIQSTTSLKLGVKSFSVTEDTHTGTTTNPWDSGLPELEKTVRVRKVLQEGKVHRLPTLEAPLSGELIITEVFRGAREYNVAVELYNSSDHDVDLRDYMMKSFDPYKHNPPATEYSSDLLLGETNDCRLLFDRKTNESYGGAGSGARKLNSYDIRNKHYILKPKQLAVFIEQSVMWHRSQVIARPNLMYVFNIGGHAYRGFHPWARGGYLELHKKIPRDRYGRTEIIDVFLKFGPGGKAQASNTAADAWSYTFMRKPDRNTPRQTMEQGVNSDWVARLRTESIDWGHRFGYESVVYNNENTNRWMDGTHNNYGFLGVNGVSDRVLTTLSTDPTHAGFVRTFGAGSPYTYRVPTWWKSPVAH